MFLHLVVYCPKVDVVALLSGKKIPLYGESLIFKYALLPSFIWHFLNMTPLWLFSPSSVLFGTVRRTCRLQNLADTYAVFLIIL